MTPRNPALRFSTAALLAALGLAPLAAADTARRFVHTTEADFEPGEADGFSVTAYGELVPVPAFDELPAPPEGVENLLALARVGENLYAAGGTAAGGTEVLRLAGDAWEAAASLENAQVFALLATGGELLVGVSAEGESRVASLTDDGLRTLVDLNQDRYVWGLAGGEGAVPLLIATGTEGRILSVSLDALGEASPDAPAAAEVVLDSAQANVLTLAASPGGFPVYAGTDTDGLVYELIAEGDPSVRGDGLVVATAFFDAPEPEVAALAVHPDGRVFAGTADADQARPGRLTGAASESTGRPDDSEVEAPEVGDNNDPDAPPPTPEPVELAAPPAPGSAADAAPPPKPAPADEPAAEPEATGADADAPSGDDSSEVEEAGPDAADYDALRETLREKLDEARETGELSLEGVAAAAAAPKPSRPRTPDQPAAEKKEGNAVYALSPDGSFREVFRETSMVLSLALDGERLLIGTGGEGELHGVDLADGTVTLVRDLESQQVTALLAGEGGVAVAASNPAAAGSLPGGSPTGEAVYTSPTLDAGRRALFGRVSLTASGPEDASIAVDTRSGSTADPDSAPWGPWTAAGELAAGDPAASLEIPAAPARFLQYRLTAAASDAAAGPAIEEVTLSYAVPNLAPSLNRLVLERAEPEDAGDPAPPTVAVSWEASDPDGDELVYAVSWKREGTDRWLSAAEGLSETSFDWPVRGLGDGRYSVRVTASDELANPPGSERAVARRSDPFLVDNTPPELTAEAADRDGEALISGTVRDTAAPVASVAFRVNDEEAFRPAGAVDLLFDSAEEAFELPLGLDPAQTHVVTLRATDAHGNASFETLVLPAR